MASPIGGIDPDILAQIQSLMQAMGPSDADKKAARSHALLTAGLGMMQNAYLNPIRAIGTGGLLGQQAYNQELQFEQQQRAQNMGQIGQFQNMAMQMTNRKMMMDALNGGGDSTQPGPPQAFQAPGGGAALMGAGVQGQDAPVNSLPTQVAGPQAQNLRARLANANLINTISGGKDLSAALKMKFPDPIPMREGADAYDPGTGTWTYGVKPPPGSYYDRTNNTFVPVKGGEQAIAQAAALPKAVDLAYTPQTGIIPGTSRPGVVGSQLDALMPNGGPLPYGAPPPYTGATKAAIDNGQLAVGQGGKLTTAARQPVQTGLSPEDTAHSTDLAEYEKAVKSTATAASKQDATLTQMDNLMKYFTPGPTLPFRADMAGYAGDIPLVGRTIANAFVPNSATALPAIQAFQKLGVQMTGAQLKDGFGTREAAQIIGMVSRAIPNAGQVPGAPQTILKFMHGINQWGHDQEQALAAWKADPAHGNSSEGFETFWNGAHPVSSYVPPMTVLEDIAAGKPPGTTPAAAPSEGTIKTTGDGIPYVDKGPAPAPTNAPQMTKAGSANTTATMIFRDALKSGDMKTIERLRAKGYVE